MLKKERANELFEEISNSGEQERALPEKALRKPLKVLLIVCALFIAFGLWVVWTNIALQVTNYTVTSHRLPDSFDGFKIVHISDLHDAEFGEDNIELVNKIQKIAPDIIVLTGDLVDAFRTDVAQSVSFARQAVRIAPTYYVPGNHEAHINDPDIYRQLADVGVTVLYDKNTVITRGEDQLYILGIQHSNHITETLQKLMPEEDAFTLLLAHKPEPFSEYAAVGPDLVLSGHVHGGQARLPFIGGLYGSNQGVFPKYDAGLYTEGDSQMIISRGLGNSRFPVRFNNRPEIVVVTLKKG